MWKNHSILELSLLENRRQEKKESLLSEIAYMYYVENKTQDEIANRTFLSRSRVSRLLEEARQHGLVEFKVRFVGERNYQLETFLVETMGLKAARVYNDIGRSEKETFEGVCHCAAEYIKPLLVPRMRIGVTHNTLLANIVRELTADNVCKNPLYLDLVQLIGNHISPPVGYSAQDIMCRLVAYYGGQINLLNVPIYISNTSLRNDLLREPMVASTLSAAKQIDMAIIGIKPIDSTEQLKEQVIWAGYLNDEELDRLIEIGTCGHILGRAIDVDGNLVSHPINRLIMGLNPSHLTQVKHSICVATGAERGSVLHGAIKGGYINTLITDRSCAQAIMDTFFRRAAAQK